MQYHPTPSAGAVVMSCLDSQIRLILLLQSTTVLFYVQCTMSLYNVLDIHYTNLSQSSRIRYGLAAAPGEFIHGTKDLNPDEVPAKPGSLELPT